MPSDGFRSGGAARHRRHSLVRPRPDEELQPKCAMGKCAAGSLSRSSPAPQTILAHLPVFALDHQATPARNERTSMQNLEFADETVGGALRSLQLSFRPR